MDIQAPAPAEPDAAHEIIKEIMTIYLSPQYWLDKYLSTFSTPNLERAIGFVLETKLPCTIHQFDSSGRMQSVHFVPMGGDIEPLKRNSTVRKVSMDHIYEWIYAAAHTI